MFLAPSARPAAAPGGGKKGGGVLGKVNVEYSILQIRYSAFTHLVMIDVRDFDLNPCASSPITNLYGSKSFLLSL